MKHALKRRGFFIITCFAALCIVGLHYQVTPTIKRHFPVLNRVYTNENIKTNQIEKDNYSATKNDFHNHEALHQNEVHFEANKNDFHNQEALNQNEVHFEANKNDNGIKHNDVYNVHPDEQQQLIKHTEKNQELNKEIQKQPLENNEDKEPNKVADKQPANSIDIDKQPEEPDISVDKQPEEPDIGVDKQPEGPADSSDKQPEIPINKILHLDDKQVKEVHNKNLNAVNKEINQIDRKNIENVPESRTLKTTSQEDTNVYYNQNQILPNSDTRIEKKKKGSDHQDLHENKYSPRHRIVHLDLKGAPPKVEYLSQLFSLIKSLGGTGLLIEWEDKFPYTESLAPVVAGNAYTKDEVKRILALAKQNQLAVIPLVQTFGHVEFILKTEQFMNLRENPHTPQALCPSKNESTAMIRTMIDQIMDAHPDSEFLHIGSDEVFVLGQCNLCRRKWKEDLLLGHVSKTAKYVREKHKVRPIIWDDMLRSITRSNMNKYRFGELVEPMLWWYTPDVRRYIASHVWSRYEDVFPTAWGAGGFKGAFGSNLFMTFIDKHVKNNMDWVDLLKEKEDKFVHGIRGLVLTGWQRYDHFAALAELLPSAVPSLALSLAAVTYGEFNREAVIKAMKTMNCWDTSYPTAIETMDWPYLYSDLSSCKFPGNEFYIFTQQYNNTMQSLNHFLKDFETGQSKSWTWMGDYAVRHKFTSALHLDENRHPFLYHHRQAVSLLTNAYHSLTPVYKNDTIYEFIEQRIYPVLDRMEKYKEAYEEIMKKETFDVRPLRHYPNDMLKYIDKYIRRRTKNNY